MFPYRRIVFPVDFSAACEAAVPYVAEAVQRFEAHLQLVHACTPEFFYTAEFGWYTAATAPSSADLERAQCIKLRAFAETQFPELQTETIVHSGPAAGVIEDTVRKNGADLIMLPTHGHGLFRRLLLGSVTTRLIHDLSCSIWTGCHIDPASLRHRIPYKRILCAVEPASDSEHVVRAAEQVAISYGASLSLVSAIEMPSGTWELDAEGFWRRIWDSAASDLESYSRILEIPVSTRLVSGPIANALRDAALEDSADLLVLGRGESQHPFSGILSSLYSIVRESPCPVLSV